MLILIYLLFVAVVFFWQFSLLSSGLKSSARSIGCFAGYAISPILLYTGGFLVLVGVEEISGHALIGEGFARTLPFVVAGGLAVVIVATVIFSLVALAVRK